MATALWYRAGTRDEAPGEEGVAHFLEHLMFRGSPAFPAGEVDARTQAVGGANNAFTGHDATAYYFTLPAAHWVLALDVEADRMAELAFDGPAIEIERRVILEEIATARDHPWDALELDVLAALYGGHPYGRPVLGTPASIAGARRGALERFHRAAYGPRRAVLAVAGGFGEGALEAIASRFGRLRGPLRERPRPPRRRFPAGVRRVERRRGETDRLLVALPAPAASHPDHAPLELLLAVLAAGRSSRLPAALVEEDRLATWVEADLTPSEGPGAVTITAEAAPGADAAAIEGALFAALARLRKAPPRARELAGARQLLLAEWAYASETVSQRAMLAGEAACLFDPGHPRRSLRRLLGSSRERLAAVARRWLDPERSSVVGWSRAER